MKIPQRIEEAVIKSYFEGKSCKEVSELFNISNGSIPNILKRYGLSCRRVGFHKKVNFFDEKIFDELNEKSAYWLGFIYADGSMNDKALGLSIGLSSKDKDHLEKFAKYLGDVKVMSLKSRVKKNGIVKEYDISRICLNSKYLYNSLVKLGCTPRKSLTLQFPTEEQVPSYLLNHFIRGYFDGDGCICKTTNMVSIIGSNIFIDELTKLFVMKGFKCTNPLKGSVKYLNIQGIEQVREFKNYIYNDATVYLERKRNIFDSKKQMSLPEIYINQRKMLEEYKNLSYKEISKLTGLSYGRIQHLRKTKGIKRMKDE